MARIILLTGFEPFGGERINPSWEVAARLDGRSFGDSKVEAVRLPVNCRGAADLIVKAIESKKPAAVISLGQAGGRVALALEKVALNLADERRDRENQGGLDSKSVVADGPAAYFSRLPLKPILRSLQSRHVPAMISLSAGVYVCNSVMYAGLHALRRRPQVPAGFIHLPFENRQTTRRPAASMSLDLMIAGVEASLEVIAKL
jgi:pyroglutamyl-peptidase